MTTVTKTQLAGHLSSEPVKNEPKTLAVDAKISRISHELINLRRGEFISADKKSQLLDAGVSLEDLSSIEKDRGRLLGGGFWDKVKQPFTASTRLVTDTVLDTANLATGMQFQKDFNKAKQAMSDAGVASVGDCIEENHYPELKPLGREVARLQRSVRELDTQNNALLTRLNDELVPNVNRMQNALVALNSVQELNAALVNASVRGEENRRNDARLSTSTQTFQRSDAQHGLGISGDVVGMLGIVSGGVLLVAKSGTRVCKVASVASVAVAVASIGLEIGMSVVDCQQKKSQLSKAKRELEVLKSQLQQEQTNLQSNTRQAESRIQQILNAFEQRSVPDFLSFVERECRRIHQANLEIIFNGQETIEEFQQIQQDFEDFLNEFPRMDFRNLSEESRNRIIARVQSLQARINAVN